MRHGISKEYARGTRRYRWCGRFPMEKFLQSRLGEKWSDVHKEMSEEFDRRTYSGYLFWRYEFGKWQGSIAVNCWIGAETGTVYNNGHRGEERVDGFYVHPFTGIICHQAPLPPLQRVKGECTRIVLNDRTAYEKIEGIWYFTKYRKEEKSYAYYPFTPYSYRSYTVLSKRQLNSETLRKNNLTNNNPEEIVEIKKELERKRQEQEARMDALLPQ